MKSFWENEGNPLPEGHKHAGEHCAVIDLENGEPPSVYYGKTHKEVADKLLAAQTNAAQRISQLRQRVAQEAPDPARAPSAPQRQALSAERRLALTRDLQDPARAPEAVREIIESEVGAPLDAMRKRMGDDAEQQAGAEAKAEAERFVASTPDWFASEYNKNLLRDYIQTRGWGWTAKNFSMAWEALKGAGLAQFKPETEATALTSAEPEVTTAEPTAPANGTRQRGVTRSSGLRASDASGASGYRPPQKYTLAKIEAMSIAELKLAEADPEYHRFLGGMERQRGAAR